MIDLCFIMPAHLISKTVWILGLLCLMCVPTSLGTDIACMHQKQVLSDDSNAQNGIYLIFAGGSSYLMGCSAGVHLSPLWFQTTTDGWVSYGFESPAVITVNGVPSFHSDSVRLYMEGFKGVAPGSVHWGLKSFIGARIRLIGICTYYELH